MSVDFLTSYLSHYSGNTTRIRRALFIAEKTKNDILKQKALAFAHDQLKLGINTSLYKSTIEKFQEV